MWVASRHIKREEVLLPVAVRNSKTPELNLNFIRGNENVTHSAQDETAFWGEFPSRRSEEVNAYFANYRFSFRKRQIFISQTTDFHFANYRFSFRFAPFRFANYSKPFFLSSRQREMPWEKTFSLQRYMTFKANSFEGN